jgi:hypothetical protein
MEREVTEEQPTLDLAPREIKITNVKHLRRVGELLGAATLLDTLQKAKCVLPGFALALALAEREVAEHRITMSRDFHKIAAGAGVDLAQANRLELIGYDMLRVSFGPDGDEP